MIEIEAAQEILIRFAAAAVLRDDQAGNDFQQLTRAQRRPQVELLRGHDTDRRGCRLAAEPLQLARYDDFFEPLTRGGNAAGESQRRQQCDQTGRSDLSG